MTIWLLIFALIGFALIYMLWWIKNILMGMYRKQVEHFQSTSLFLSDCLRELKESIGFVEIKIEQLHKLIKIKD